MQKAIAINSPPITARDVPLSASARAVIDATTTLLKSLSPIEQEWVLTHLQQLLPSGATPKAGVVLGAIVNLLERERSHRKEWTVPEIKQAVEHQGVSTNSRGVYNAIGYLARRGRIKQLSYGRYLLLDYGIGIETADNFGIEPDRNDFE